jgi:hypothetical protein
VRDPSPEGLDHAIDVLVGKHAEHGPGMAVKGHVAQVGRQCAGRLGVVGNVEHHHRATRQDLEAPRQFHLA